VEVVRPMSSRNGSRSWHFLILSTLNCSINWWDAHRKWKCFTPTALSHPLWEVDRLHLAFDPFRCDLYMSGPVVALNIRWLLDPSTSRAFDLMLFGLTSLSLSYLKLSSENTFLRSKMRIDTIVVHNFLCVSIGHLWISYRKFVNGTKIIQISQKNESQWYHSYFFRWDSFSDCSREWSSCCFYTSIWEQWFPEQRNVFCVFECQNDICMRWSNSFYDQPNFGEQPSVFVLYFLIWILYSHPSNCRKVRNCRPTAKIWHSKYVAVTQNRNVNRTWLK
jgi:hypothetical protein